MSDSEERKDESELSALLGVSYICKWLADEKELTQAINTWLIAHDELPEGVNL